MKLNFLRKKYPKFVYEKYSYGISGKNSEISFNFLIEPDIEFRPKIIIKGIDKKRIEKIGSGILDNLVFHLGLMEIPNYWKATCSPAIEIKAGYLNKEQIKWWKDLIIDGLGQFFYENKINWKKPDFLKITSSQKSNGTRTLLAPLKDRYLVPLGGGKDSIVTLEILKEAKKELRSFSLNPSWTIRKITKIGDCGKPIVVRRKIDKKLLELNRQGFLNGHTPFSAYLAFLAVLTGVLFDYKHLAFSNEKSADEGNVRYLGKIINHQWSKSSEFERKFRDYSKKYLAKNIKYFSFLRKYGELKIAKMFIKYSKYFPVFSSCNAVAAKKLKQRWCGNCPKCLFVYAASYPFLKEEQLLQIFGRDIFENRKLLPTMLQLIGKRGFKPFECVGTKKESRLAFELSLKKAKKSGKVPYLLTKYNEVR